jgi:enoyl-CoA hydratase/carnithine racemase
LPQVDYTQIACSVTDHVATIALDRPERLNALTDIMVKELLHAFDVVDADDSVRAVVVTGRGRGFCAGADLAAGAETFSRGGSDVMTAAGIPRDGGGMVSLRIFRCTKPVIAAINGPAVGGGVTITLPMDIRLASEEARFGFVFTRRGVVPEACSSWFLPRLVGMQQAAEWVLTGRVFPADEALGGGLVRSVHPAGELLPAAYALAAEVVQNAAPVSVALSRQLLWRMLGAEHPMIAHRADSRGILERGRSDDAREGVTSFLEKRPPRFPLKVSDGLPDLFPGWVEPEFE